MNVIINNIVTGSKPSPSNNYALSYAYMDLLHNFIGQGRIIRYFAPKGVKPPDLLLKFRFTFKKREEGGVGGTDVICPFLVKTEDYVLAEDSFNEWFGLENMSFPNELQNFLTDETYRLNYFDLYSIEEKDK